MITKDNDQELERLRVALQEAMRLYNTNPTAETEAAYEAAIVAYKRRRFWVVEQTKDKWESEI